ncbi:MAG: hypothetical protein ACRCXT_23875 [Paraclostridium sp.]
MRITKKDIINRITFLNSQLGLNMYLDYNSSYTAKFTLTFDGKDRWSSDKKLYFEKASECFSFLEGIQQLNYWNIFKVNSEVK